MMKYVTERVGSGRDGGDDTEPCADVGRPAIPGVAPDPGARLDLPLPGRHGDARAWQHHTADVKKASSLPKNRDLF